MSVIGGRHNVRFPARRVTIGIAQCFGFVSERRICITVGGTQILNQDGWHLFVSISLCRQRLVALLDKSGGHHGCFAYCVVEKKASMSESGPIRPSKQTTKPNERCLRIRTGCIATVGGTQFAQFGVLRGPDWMGGTFSTGGWHLSGRGI